MRCNPIDNFHKCLFLLLFLFASPLILFSQKPVGDSSNIVSAFGRMLDSAEVSHPPGITGLTGISSYDSMMLKKYAEKQIYHMEHEMSAFRLQYISSIIIFLMVIIIVALGLYLSYSQFKLSEKLLSQPIKINETIEKEPEGAIVTQSSFEVGKDGVKINTAVIGLMILVISLVFFFLYLKFVYKINVIA